MNNSRSATDTNAPPSRLLKNYYQFKGEHLTSEERADLFSGDSIFLRRVAAMAAQKYTLVESVNGVKAS